jgi:replicative DNA helicase
MRRENKPPPSAPTGMAELDKRIGGLRAGRLYILTAETKSGKTSMATQWFWSVLQAGVPAMLLSMEMTCEEVTERIAVQRTHLPREGALPAAYAVELKEMIKTFAGMANAAMVDDRGRLTIEEMRERTRAWIEREDVKAWRKGSIAGVLLVDYLQLSGSMKKNATKEQEIAEVSQGLKEVAKEFGIAVVALAQLNRQGTLRHSGQIEQDADCVLRLKEEDNDTALSSPFIVREPPKVRRMALVIERIRNGESGSIAVEFNGPLTSFKEL